MSMDENNPKPTSPLGGNKYKKPISWKPGTKVTNSSNLASSAEKSDSVYAPKDDPLSVDPGNEIDPVDLLKEKKNQRESETLNKETDSEVHPVPNKPEKVTRPDLKMTPAPEEEVDKDSVGDKQDNAARESNRKSSVALFYVLFIFLLGGIGFTAWKLEEQKKNRPPSTYEVLKETLTSLRQRNNELGGKLRLVNDNELAKARLAMASKNVANCEEILSTCDEKQVAYIQQILAKQEEMLAYYKRYRTYTQRMAKGMYVAEIQTKSGRLFTEVTITKCGPSEISIMHSSGATRIPIGDLPDPIQDRLAYTNPFSDVANALKQTKEALARVGMAGKATAPIPSESLPPLPDQGTLNTPLLPGTFASKTEVPETTTPDDEKASIPTEAADPMDIPLDLPPAL